jgi:hypothetical protein
MQRIDFIPFKRWDLKNKIQPYKCCEVFEIGWDGADWIDVAQDRDQWRALVNTVMNLRVP